MEREFRLPDLGEGLTDAELVRWLVAEGERVGYDQPLAVVTTAKAEVELPSPYEGVVTARYGRPGEVLPVGAALVRIETGGDGATPGPQASPAAPDTAAAEGGAPRDDQPGGARAASQLGALAGSGPVLVGYGTGHGGTPGRRRRPLRPGHGMPPATRPPSTGAPTGASAASVPGAPSTVVAGRSVAPAQPGERRTASPLVRRLAREQGVDLARVPGTGPGGLVTRRDLEHWLANPAHAPGRLAAGVAVGPGEPSVAGLATSATSREGRAGPELSEETRVAPPGDGQVLTGAARVMAERMALSHREVAAAAAWLEVDATQLLAVAKAWADGWAGEGRAARPPTPFTCLLRLVVVALRAHPELNAHFDGTTLRRAAGVHLGIATQTDRGLLVPVVAHAEGLDLPGLSRAAGAAVAGARAGTSRPDELIGATFTVSNYGALGADGGVPMIDPPQVAILGVGRIAPRPAVVEDRLEVQARCQLTLTFDHRVLDGAAAAGFLVELERLVRNPVLAL